MKRTKYLVLLLLVLSLISIAAANGRVPTGQRINMISGPETVTLEVGEPFHVTHGWSCGYCKELAEYGIWGYKCGAGHVPFTLMLDGEDIHFTYMESWPDNKWPLVIEGVEYIFKFKWYMWTFNFQDGLDAGTYELTGSWHDICENWYVDCEKPLERMNLQEKTITVIVE